MAERIVTLAVTVKVPADDPDALSDIQSEIESGLRRCMVSYQVSRLDTDRIPLSAFKPVGG